MLRIIAGNLRPTGGHVFLPPHLEVLQAWKLELEALRRLFLIQNKAFSFKNGLETASNR